MAGGWAPPIAWVMVAAMLGGMGCESSKPAAAPARSGTTSGVVEEEAGDEGKGSPALRLDLEAKPKNEAEMAAETGSIRFREVTETAGIEFVLVSGNDANKNFPTANGAGAAMIDYDVDGDMDLFFATTRHFPLDGPTTSKGCALYRNRGDATFENVTEAAGVGFHGFTHTPLAGDVNGDGFPDLFLTNFGPNVLYLNNGDGSFRDGSGAFGGEVPPWSSGAAFLDYDLDGHLDLYVSCYGAWSLDSNEYCGDRALNVRTYCTPLRITPTRDYLYRNRGDGTFEEVTAAAGVLRDDGRGMGVLAIDVNLDGLVDLWVANDLNPKYLFLNKGDGKFEDVSELSGASAAENGANQSGMGVDGEDLTGDGFPELFSTHFQNDYNTLYRNLDGENFQDVTSATGTVRDSFPDVGWGCALSDFDLDGNPDMCVVNGHVDDNVKLLGDDQPQAETAKVWRGLGDVKFALARRAGAYFERPYVTRGACFGDLDNDGDTDIVVCRMDDRPAILLNESERGHWVELELIGGRANRDAVGALVEIHAGGRVLHRQVKGGGSYHSSNDHRLQVGLGGAERIERIVIRWPRGTVTRLENPAIDRIHQVREIEPEASDAGPGAVEGSGTGGPG